MKRAITMPPEGRTAGLWEQPAPYVLPHSVEMSFVRSMECPFCHSHLLMNDAPPKSPDKVYCPVCGWKPRDVKKTADIYTEAPHKNIYGRPVFTMNSAGQIFWGEDQPHDDIPADGWHQWAAEIARGEIDRHDEYPRLAVFPDHEQYGWSIDQIVDHVKKAVHDEGFGDLPFAVTYYNNGKFDRFLAKWYDDPERAEWQHGLCDTYAKALMDTHPHLRLGVLLDPETNVEQHYFAHDDQNAYDSIGIHPLPYTGYGENEGQFIQALDQDPAWYGIGGPYPYGENGSKEDYDRALALIQRHHQISKVAHGYGDDFRTLLGMMKNAYQNEEFGELLQLATRMQITADEMIPQAREEQSFMNDSVPGHRDLTNWIYPQDSASWQDMIDKHVKLQYGQFSLPGNIKQQAGFIEQAIINGDLKGFKAEMLQQYVQSALKQFHETGKWQGVWKVLKNEGGEWEQAMDDPQNSVNVIDTLFELEMSKSDPIYKKLQNAVHKAEDCGTYLKWIESYLDEADGHFQDYLTLRAPWQEQYDNHQAQLQWLYDIKDVAPGRTDMAWFYSKEGMAADPEFVQQWIQENGPYVYHGIRPSRVGMSEEQTIQSIKQNGIVPDLAQRVQDDGTPATKPNPTDYGVTEEENPFDNSEYYWDHEAWWLGARPGHVFMVTDPTQAYGPIVATIDLRQLDPTRIKPDDDYWRDHIADDTGENTLGEHMNEIGWGDDPEDTHRGGFGHGVIAYEGAVPSNAIVNIRHMELQEQQTPYDGFMMLHYVPNWTHQYASFDMPPLENPVSYEWTPWTDQELSQWHGLNDEEKAAWKRRSRNLTRGARRRGYAGTVMGRDLWLLNNRYRGNCAYCGQPGADSWDHVKPLSQGGEHIPSNILPAHLQCNYELGQWDDRNRDYRGPSLPTMEQKEWTMQPAEAKVAEVEEAEFGDPWSPIPKYFYGERVVFRGGQGAGMIVNDEPEIFEGGWWYRVQADDGKTYQAPEEALLRPGESDRPGEDTLESLGIPPEAEEYYRRASQIPLEASQSAPNGTRVQPWILTSALVSLTDMQQGEEILPYEHHNAITEQQGLKAWVDGQPAGNVTYEIFPNDYLFAHWIYVEPEYRNSGVMRAMIDELYRRYSLPISGEFFNRTGLEDYIARRNVEMTGASERQPWNLRENAKLAWKRIEPSEELRNIAHGYMANQGWGDYDPPQDYPDVDPARAKRIADEYERMEHDPHNPQVRAAYDALMQETQKQYEYLLKHGYQFEFEPHQGAYNSPWDAIDDIRNNKHLYVYPTYAAFGQGDDDGLGDVDHPLVEHTGYYWNDTPVTYNDLFRGVHDVFGHAKEGVGFRQDGEENAWRQHAAMYSDLARHALTSETRGQNSYVNFGPFAEHNQRANQEDTVYAPQKAGLMPEWTAYEGAGDDDLPSTGYGLPQDRSSTTVESSSTLDRASNWQPPSD